MQRILKMKQVIFICMVATPINEVCTPKYTQCGPNHAHVHVLVYKLAMIFDLLFATGTSI